MNSPANPTGRVLPAGQLAAMVRGARERGAVLASDECYIGLGWTAEPVSVLHPDVCGGSFDGLLAVHSVSKRSNLAGYRAGFVTGDPALVAELLEIRKHAGMMMPAPVQAAMTAALGDDAHAERQREVYAARRDQLRPALEKAGLDDHPLRGGPVPVGLAPGARLLVVGAAARRGGHPRRARGVLRPGRRAAHPGGPHRHRRAGGRGRPPPGHPRLTNAPRGAQRRSHPERPLREALAPSDRPLPYRAPAARRPGPSAGPTPPGARPSRTCRTRLAWLPASGKEGTMTVVTSPSDVAHPFTVADLEGMPDDGRRYELIDGELLVSPAPGWAHQAVVLALSILLRSGLSR